MKVASGLRCWNSPCWHAFFHATIGTSDRKPQARQPRMGCASLNREAPVGQQLLLDRAETQSKLAFEPCAKEHGRNGSNVVYGEYMRFVTMTSHGHPFSDSYRYGHGLDHWLGVLIVGTR
jgi:hypothetical protein